MKAPLHGLNVRFAKPRGTNHSREHDKTMIKYRPDKHTASAYLIKVQIFMKSSNIYVKKQVIFK